ncbi:hypothetical protein N8339_06615 [Gammaproteobacteria bacterium]|nr:hypothetical protein [Gammaproteobacteria bacterium]
MAEAMQGAMPLPPQMGNMSAEMAAVEEMRKQVSPSEVNNEMLMAAEQADPIAVAEFRRELEEMEIPPEVLALLNTMVDEVLADPANYAAIRERYMAQGVDEELLPEAFDAQLFGALQVALDQLRAPDTMAPPQNFAKGGIASLRPMAQAMADAGRNGDTMVAHISPIEAQILRRIGGSGTTNPTTGMPEFFLKKLFKKIGKTVKKFANTAIGKIVIGTALFMVAGPATAGMLFGSTAAPALVAATSGFVAGAGTSLLGGRNLKDSLKAGAIGAVTAGAVSGVTQGASAFKSTAAPTGAPVTTSVPTVDNTALPDLTTTARETVAAGTPMPGIDTAAIDQASQLARLTEPSAAQSFAAGPQGPALSRSAIPPTPVQSGVASLDRAAIDQASQAARLREIAGSQTAATGGQTAPSSFFGNIKETFAPGDATLGDRVGSLKDAFSPSARQAAGAERAQLAGSKAFADKLDFFAQRGITENTPGYATAVKAAQEASSAAVAANTSGAISNYLPLAAAGMGIAGLSGAFSPEQPQLPPGFEGMMDAPGQRLLEQYPERYGLSFGGVNTMSQTAPYQTYRPYGAATGGSTTDFPRKNGPINGPGTGTSDDIPAMLSDGEFVFTAKAVRNMGNGSRRKGAKKMYALMKNLEGRANG